MKFDSNTHYYEHILRKQVISISHINSLTKMQFTEFNGGTFSDIGSTMGTEHQPTGKQSLFVNLNGIRILITRRMFCRHKLLIKSLCTVATKMLLTNSKFVNIELLVNAFLYPYYLYDMIFLYLSRRYKHCILFLV